MLSIGTMESSNAVGLGLDLRVLAARGTRAFSVVAAVSAQSANGVRALHAVPAAEIAAQIDALPLEELGAVRIGALPSLAAVDVVAKRLARLAGLPIVIDPVLASSRGGALATEPTLDALRDRLLPLAAVVLPNLAEAAALTNRRIDDDRSMVEAGRRLVALGARAALVTGGHLAGDPVDVLVEAGSAPRRFAAPRIAREMRGTGCLLAVSLAAELAASEDADGLASAILRARATVRTAIAHARRVGDQWVTA